jgi:hypothetical protein
VDKPQKSIIYELLVAMDTGAVTPNRTFSPKSLSDTTKTMKTNLKLKSVESRMQNKREHECDNILSTLRQCTMDKAIVNTRGMNEEDREVIELEGDIEQETIEDEDALLLEQSTVELDDVAMDEADVTSSTEKGYNVNCTCDVWTKGKELLRNDDIKNTRNNEHNRFERERKLMEAIGDYIKNANSSKRETKLRVEDEDMSDTEAVCIAKDLSMFK